MPQSSYVVSVSSQNSYIFQHLHLMLIFIVMSPKRYDFNTVLDWNLLPVLSVNIDRYMYANVGGVNYVWKKSYSYSDESFGALLSTWKSGRKLNVGKLVTEQQVVAKI